MPKIIRGIGQNTPEWMDLRIGSVGSTIINDIAPRKDSYKKALYKLAGEIVTGAKADSKKFRYAARGHEFEDKGRKLYMLKTGNIVEQIAMIKGDKPHTHTSTDGIIEKDGFLEVKVRIASIWLELAEGGLEPIADRRQRHWGLYISKRKWVDSVNFCPEIAMAGNGGILIKRATRNEKKIKELENVSDVFIKEMLKLANKYK